MIKSLEQIRQELEQTPQPQLDQASLERVYEETRSSNIGFITAHRSDYSAEENLGRSRQLKSDIRSSGFGFRFIDGHFIENHGTSDARKVAERAYMVIGRKGDDRGNLMDFLKKYGAKCDQDCVIYKAHNETDANLIATTHRTGVDLGLGEKRSLGTFHPNRAGEYQAALRNHEALTFESRGIVEINGEGFFGELGKYVCAKKIYEAQFRDSDDERAP
jgi:hypothetical protein